MDSFKVENVFLWLMSYSVLGWMYETVFCSVTEGHFVNRGVLNGPYCMIYGFGALFLIALLSKVENPVVLFFTGAGITCALEYFTSYVLELLFHARWWDYSNSFLNLNGRICLVGAIAFGTFSVLLIKVIHPNIQKLIELIPQPAKHIITIMLFVLLIADIIITLQSLSDFPRTPDGHIAILG